MEVMITIRVFDKDWLDKSHEDQQYFEELKEPADLELMKYRESFSFKLAFGIRQHTVSSKVSINLGDTTLSNLTVVTFKGKDQTASLAISSSLLASDFSATSSGRKLYCYFYIKPDIPYFRVGETIWLDEEAHALLPSI